jgi:hypothetical protein
MNKSNISTNHPTAPGQASAQIFGYVQPTRLYKLGKRVLVYRVPGDGKQLAISKPLVFLIVMLLAAFVTGYVNGGHVAKQSGGRTLPTAVAPTSNFHRLLTISAVSDVGNLPVNAGLRNHVQTWQPYRTV